MPNFPINLSPRKIKNPPRANPTETGKTPSNSVAGIIKLVKLAANIIPAARPREALIVLDDMFFTRKILDAPKTFITARKRPPSKAKKIISNSRK
jgi:hypothetical protein